MSTTTTPITGGWFCSRCNAWVPNEIRHTCATFTGINFYPCNGSQTHDFAVGPTHAVCNRCERIVLLAKADQ